ncbi:MAG: hypothetical protein BGO67_01965 [Alphaproteobacteria bacterium 41-28]|nr:MAG: hypothetical protein BGO67_01965 [Alphaproteobacteria bacterium 41-28]
MNINKPLVSIIIPVFNGADYLSQAIDSALEQTYQNIEIIVVNDGSNDQGATEKIALSYGTKIFYYEKENGGVATALNLGISKMKGEYFSWLSHDDLYTPDKIENQILEMSQYDDKTILYSDYKVFEKDPSDSYEIQLPSLPPRDFRYWITIENSLHGCTLLIPKSAFEEHGSFNPNLKTTQDYALWFNLAKTYKFIHLPKITVFARSHPNQGSISLSSIAKRECDTLIKNFIDHLERDEITCATKKDLKFSYIEIAQSCVKRGFIDAYVHANELAFQQECEELINDFIDQLEMTHFSKKDLKCNYQKLAHSYLKKGLMNAYVRENAFPFQQSLAQLQHTQAQLQQTQEQLSKYQNHILIKSLNKMRLWYRTLTCTKSSF